MRGVLAWLVCVAPALLPAQTPLTVAQHIALGDSAHAALVPPQALAHFRAAYAIDTNDYEGILTWLAHIPIKSPK